jgi:hypothetical protein
VLALRKVCDNVMEPLIFAHKTYSLVSYDPQNKQIVSLTAFTDVCLYWKRSVFSVRQRLIFKN